MLRHICISIGSRPGGRRGGGGGDVTNRAHPPSKAFGAVKNIHEM